METLNSQIPTFLKTHTQFDKQSNISSESVELFLAKANPKLLPEILIQFWAEYGISRFSDGLLYFCDPVKKKSTLSFFNFKKDVYPICISSFGNVLFTDLDKIYFLSPIYGWFNYNSPNFELLFEGTLIDEDFIKDVFDLRFHQRCLKKLGSLEKDEIFGFEPAIALGGNDEDINMVKKFQMDAHLAFLSQLVELEER
jgi:hypothetical protein